MNSPVKQHLIDPELCIRCYTCESMCSVQAIEHDGVNVVVDFDKCNGCMDCIAPCPTGSIDNWFVVATPFSLDAQFSWTELPPRPAGPVPAPPGRRPRSVRPRPLSPRSVSRPSVLTGQPMAITPSSPGSRLTATRLPGG